MNYIKKGALFIALLAMSMGCKDDLVYNDLFRDNRPAVPVTFTGATTYGFNPYIETSVAAGGAIKFTLSVPASSGRTIKEITRVGAGATGINAGTLNSAGYNTAPIAATGTTVDFTTTIAEFKTKRATVASNPIALPNFTEIAFIFLVTLDDNTQIVTQQVRVRVLA